MSSPNELFEELIEATRAWIEQHATWTQLELTCTGDPSAAYNFMQELDRRRKSAERAFVQATEGISGIDGKALALKVEVQRLEQEVAIQDAVYDHACRQGNSIQMDSARNHLEELKSCLRSERARLEGS